METNRTQLLLTLCRRYLTHVQQSVFEGEISQGDLQQLRNEIEDTLIAGESVIVYELSSDTLLNRTVYGEDPTEDNRFL
jgi:CRISPR-associated protein Cas2